MFRDEFVVKKGRVFDKAWEFHFLSRETCGDNELMCKKDA